MMSLRTSRHPLRRCRGSVVVQTAIALSLVVIVLIGTELGYLFYLKREMQKAVDLAALAGAQALQGTDCDGARNAALANATLNLPTGLALNAGDIRCGRWDPITNAGPLHFAAPTGMQPHNAVSITMQRAPALLLPALPGNQARTIAVQALAAQRLPRAALTLRSTVASIDPARATLLNAVLGGMLGGSLSLDAVGYNALLGSQLKLLGFVDQLALDIGVAAGQYDTVLSTPVSAGRLLQAAVTALRRQGNTAEVAITALDTLRISAQAASAQPLLQLGDLLGVQSGTPAAALGLDLQVFQLAEGIVQLANGQNGLVASIPLTVPGLLNVTTRVQVIEPPQMSAVGDPTLARLDPTGANAIAVRTAQVRTLVTVDLPALNGVSALVNAVGNALIPVTTLLNDVLHLDLVSALSCLLCTRTVTDMDLLPPPVRLDINLDAGGGHSHVTDFDCTDGAKSLTAQTRTAAAELRIGKMGATAAAAATQVFSSPLPPHVDPVPLLDIGGLQCTSLLNLVTLTCNEATRVAYYGGGLGLQGDVPVAAADASQLFVDPPEVGSTPAWQAVSSQNLVDSLGHTLQASAGLVRALPAKGGSGGASASVLNALAATLGGVISALGTVVSSVAAPLLDAVLNTVLRDVVGLDLAKTEVGAQMSCTRGAELVY
jgi:uncharacterized membrane protein